MSREYILSLLTFSIETLQLILLCGAFFPPRRSSATESLKLLLCLILAHLYKMAALKYTFAGTVYSMLLDFLLIECVYTGSHKKKALSLMLFYVLLSVTDLTALALVTRLTDYSWQKYYGSYADVAAMLLSKSLSYLLLGWVLRKRGRPLFSDWWAVLIPLGCVCLLCYEFGKAWQPGSLEELRLLALLGCSLLLLNGALLAVRVLRQKAANLEAEYRQAFDAQKGWHARIEEGYTSVRKLYHDMRKFILYLRSALQKQDVEGARDYLKAWDTELREAVSRPISGNDVADAILSAKLAACEEMGIPVHISGKLPPSLGMSDYDLSRLLGNLIDNAFAACSELSLGDDDRQIWIDFYMEESGGEKPAKLHICMRNGYRKKATKPGGYGLAIVGDIAQKYGGVAEFEKKGLFVAVVCWNEYR